MRGHPGPATCHRRRQPSRAAPPAVLHLTVLATALSAGCTAELDSAFSEQRDAVVEHWAPAVLQDVDSSDARADYIVRIDFDGDFRGNNNWRNLEAPGADLGAHVYYAVTETETHWFLAYYFFHPRDWEEQCSRIIYDKCHENDLEGAILVVAKNESQWGSLELVLTQAHGEISIFRHGETLRPSSAGRHRDAALHFTEDSRRVELFVEAKGHGVCPRGYSAGSYCSQPVEPPSRFPGGDGIVYLPGPRAQSPDEVRVCPGDTSCPVWYQLLPFEDSVWPLRSDACGSGCLFDAPHRYRGLMELGMAFDGNHHRDDAANPPWAWHDGGLPAGDLFFDPATAVRTWVETDQPWSTTYLFNPYLDALYSATTDVAEYN